MRAAPRRPAAGRLAERPLLFDVSRSAIPVSEQKNRVIAFVVENVIS